MKGHKFIANMGCFAPGMIIARTSTTEYMEKGTICRVVSFYKRTYSEGYAVNVRVGKDEFVGLDANRFELYDPSEFPDFDPKVFEELSDKHKD